MPVCLIYRYHTGIWFFFDCFGVVLGSGMWKWYDYFLLFWGAVLVVQTPALWSLRQTESKEFVARAPRRTYIPKSQIFVACGALKSSFLSYIVPQKAPDHLCLFAPPAYNHQFSNLSPWSGKGKSLSILLLSTTQSGMVFWYAYHFWLFSSLILIVLRGQYR